jgi:hypothetical protein
VPVSCILLSVSVQNENSVDGYTLRSLLSGFIASKIRELLPYVLQFHYSASNRVVSSVTLDVYRSVNFSRYLKP